MRKFVRESGLILSTAKVWEKAAKFWAISRQKGLPGCEDAALDGDMILCAHAYVYEGASGRKDVLIATDNLKHFVHTWPKSKSWKDISVS